MTPRTEVGIPKGSRRLRIDFLTTADTWHVPLRVKYLAGAGHQVRVLGIERGVGRPVKLPPGVRNIRIQARPERLLAAWDIARAVRTLTQGTDILHIMGMGYSIYAPFASAKRVVLENNGSDVLVAPQEQPWRKLLYRWTYRYADAVVQDSGIAREAGIRLGAPALRNEVIELGVDFSVFNRDVAKGNARRSLGLGDEPIVFSPRGFDDIYNIDTIIRSVPLVRRACPRVRYVFCHHYGDLAEKLRGLAADLGAADSIVFAGYLDHERDMPGFYGDANAVVSVPSSDSSPRSVYEAMACGAPVVVSRLPWYEGRFSDRKEILAVPLRDPAALAQAILGILDGSQRPDVRSASAKVKEHLDMTVHARRLEALFLRLLTAG